MGKGGRRREQEIIGVDLFVFYSLSTGTKQEEVEYFIGNQLRKTGSLWNKLWFGCGLCTRLKANWAAAIPWALESGRFHPHQWGDPFFPSINPFLPAENCDFCEKAIFLLKCQPNLEITEAPTVESLKRLKEAWKLFGNMRPPLWEGTLFQRWSSSTWSLCDMFSEACSDVCLHLLQAWQEQKI